MIAVPEVVLKRVAAAKGRDGEGLPALAARAARALPRATYGGVIAATFSHPNRFPALAVSVAAELGLGASVPAFDLQMACSAYPYALYLAGRLACDTGKDVLVIDGDVQTPLVDSSDAATNAVFSDAATATVVSVNAAGTSSFDFLSRASDDLVCPAAGPIRMDGFKVFTFVATEVTRFLRSFGTDFDLFVPHQAQPYMVRQLARTLDLTEKLVALPEDFRNPGSASIACALATVSRPGARALVAGFGAGYSAAAGVVRLAADFAAF